MPLRQIVLGDARSRLIEDVPETGAFVMKVTLQAAFDHLQPRSKASNSRLRKECLNASWFRSMDGARTRIDSRRADYNKTRPQSSLGNLTPSEFAAAFIVIRKAA